MDFVEDRFLLVIKDQDWNEDQIRLCQGAIQCHLCSTADIFIVVVEGGAIDSSDFYFDIQECDWQQQLLSQETLNFDLILLNEKDEICLKKSKTLTKADTQKVIDCLKKQSEIEFHPGEYDVNVEGLQNAYEPYELIRFALVQFNF